MPFPKNLREFLLLTDPTYPYWRSAFHTILFPHQYVLWYDIAKQSYEKYGDDGLLCGKLVRTLQAGHGGNYGALRTFTGIYENDTRFFQITRKEERGGQYIDQPSMVLREHWWLNIMDADDWKDEYYWGDGSYRLIDL